MVQGGLWPEDAGEGVVLVRLGMQVCSDWEGRHMTCVKSDRYGITAGRAQNSVVSAVCDSRLPVMVRISFVNVVL